MNEPEKSLTVTIQTKELKYAIMNKSRVVARSLRASGKMSKEAAAYVQAAGDMEDSYELLRAISDGIADAKVELGEYLDEANTTADNLINGKVERDEPVILNFLLPSNYDSVAASSLGSGIHDYIAGRSVYEWYRQTCPEIAEPYGKDAAAALLRAKRALYKRNRPARPE